MLKSLKITKNIKEANLITHNGTFHSDDVFSTMFLSKIIDKPIVCRTSDPTSASPNAIIYDIGYGEFDHHGPNAKIRQDNNIKYCSFGLLWEKYGYQYIASLETPNPKLLYKNIEEKLIKQIDAIDNGVFPEIKANYTLMDLPKVIDLFNKAWNEKIDNDDNFIEAVSIAEIIFDRLIIKESALIQAQKEIEKIIPKVQNGILILDEYIPYHDAIFNSTLPQSKEIKIIIFPSNRGGYNIKPMTISKDSKELAYHFDESYYGLQGEELRRVSGIKTAQFVHANGFIASTKTLEDAIKLANNALKE